MIHKPVFAENQWSNNNTTTIARCAYIILVSSLTVTRSISHNVISITAWRLSWQICHAVESCQFCTVCQCYSLTMADNSDRGIGSAHNTVFLTERLQTWEAGQRCDSQRWLKATLFTCGNTRHLSDRCSDEEGTTRIHSIREALIPKKA